MLLLTKLLKWTSLLKSKKRTTEIRLLTKVTRGSFPVTQEIFYIFVPYLTPPPQKKPKNLGNTWGARNITASQVQCLPRVILLWVKCLNDLLVMRVAFQYWHVIGQHWALVYVYDKLQACDLLQENLDKNKD